LKLLQRYPWPGNIRELRHAVERAVIMCGSSTLEVRDFSLSFDDHADRTEIDDFNLTQVQRALVARAIEKHQGNISQAAAELGLTRASLYRRIQKYGL
jgi:two-component system response regulator HydG